MKVYPFALPFLISFTAVLAKHSELPLQVDNFLGTYCLDCHDSETRKGEVSLDLLEIDWTDPHSAKIWGRVFEVIESGEMPPEKKKQPSDMEIQEVSNWLSHVLLENDKPGGTVLRRLSKDEYEKSVSSLFKIPFTVPSSFPSDLVSHGFDNHGEDLVLSPTLMAEYLEIATAAADRVLPPPRQKQRIDEQTITISPRDFTLNFTTGHQIDGVLRMVSSSDPLARGSVWPNRFEAKAAGIYRVKVDLSYFKPVDGHVPEVHLLSHQADGNNFARASELKKLAEFKVPMEKASTFVAEVELQPGETIVIHYENAALHSDQTKDQSKHIARVSQQLIDLFRGDHELGAAWMKAGYVRGDRGWGWLEKIEAIRQEGGLDIEGFDPESSEVKKFASSMSRQPLVLVETMCCYHFSKGPGLDVHRMSVTGPLPSDRKKVKLPANEFSSMDFTGNLTEAQRYRLVTSRGTVAGSAVWPSRFEAKISGIYNVQFDATAFAEADALYPAPTDVYEIELYARPSAGNAYQPLESMRKVGEVRMGPQVGQVQNFSAEVKLEKGETLAFRWANGPLYSDEGETDYSPKAFGELAKNKAIYAVVNEMGTQVRELPPADFYEAAMKRVREGNLNLDDPALKKAPNFKSIPVLTAFIRIARQDLIRHGPAVDLIGASIDGPIRLVEDTEMKEQRLRTARFMGEREGRDDREYAESILRPIINTAFRRPATDAQVEKYLNIALNHQADGHRFEDGIHLALRAVLCSPNFLYRGQREGKLDDYDLAARLSFFLTSAPPDTLLQKLAAKGQLSQPAKLEEQTRRLLNDRRVKNFLTSFTDQWLDLNVLPDIMPDSRLLKWNEKDLAAIIAETELFVAEILRENHPIETFIDPSFTYLNKRNAKLYNIKFPNSDTMTRVGIKPGGRHGGILGQASVMMATANGVDTQPVLRGVWLLENVLGDPVPEPPPEVPAVEPDTSGAKSIRELLQKHNADPSCAGCHKKIDPPGFALENFDPVGRWRDFYPVYEKVNGKVVRKDGLPVDAVGTMLDGTELRDVTDLKSYLVKNIDIFGNCLAEKLLVYATGRDLGFTERKEVEKVVKNVRQSGNGFQDLIVALVLSESFQTK